MGSQKTEKSMRDRFVEAMAISDQIVANMNVDDNYSPYHAAKARNEKLVLELARRISAGQDSIQR
ncbi:MAG: hypothetical protein OXF31_12625 [Gammaproteobacteria bacterium]|nr:hypothetical protein [Gammaproteobacteria bacterium]